MPANLDELARTVLERGETLHCDVNPADFGSPDARLAAFKNFLQSAVERHPDIRLSVVGRAASLCAIGLLPGAVMYLVNHRCPVSLGQTDTEGKVRINVARRDRSTE